MMIKLEEMLILIVNKSKDVKYSRYSLINGHHSGMILRRGQNINDGFFWPDLILIPGSNIL